MKQKPLLTWDKTDQSRPGHPLPEITQYSPSGLLTGEPEGKCHTNSTQFILCLLYLFLSHVGSSFASTMSIRDQHLLIEKNITCIYERTAKPSL
jgi:hypothetical protein